MKAEREKKVDKAVDIINLEKYELLRSRNSSKNRCFSNRTTSRISNHS